MKKLLYLAAIALIMVGCYPKGPAYVADKDMVLTNYADTFQFAEQQTYYLFDTIVSIDDNDVTQSNKYSDEILSEIRTNMNELGYEELNTLGQQPDVIITTTAWSQTTTNFYYSGYDYWGWGYPGYGPGYGWGYPAYGWNYAYTYSTGTILIEMSYPDGMDTQEQYIPLVWRAGINGLLSGSTSDIRSRITSNIDQAFEQSPYLLSNPE